MSHLKIRSLFFYKIDRVYPYFYKGQTFENVSVMFKSLENKDCLNMDSDVLKCLKMSFEFQLNIKLIKLLSCQIKIMVGMAISKDKSQIWYTYPLFLDICPIDIDTPEWL